MFTSCGLAAAFLFGCTNPAFSYHVITTTVAATKTTAAAATTTTTTAMIAIS
jgi:hypothetical protein